MTANLGKALSLVHRFWEYCDEDEDFGSAMGAPMDELRPIINRGRAKGFRRIKRRIKGLTGLRWKVFCREVERRTTPKWVHFHTQLGREHHLQRHYDF